MSSVPRKDRLTDKEWEAIYITAPVGFESMYQDELSGLRGHDSWMADKIRDWNAIERARTKLLRARKEGRV